MKAKAPFSFVLAKAIKIRIQLFLVPALFYLIFTSYTVNAQYPVVTVRFNNPEYVCATQTYSLDVEFQCNTASKQLHGMNVRFYYDDNILEFLSFGEFISGYGITTPNPPIIENDPGGGGMELFGLSGPWEYINGAIKKTSYATTYLPTSGWLKLYNISFHVDDPESMNDPEFCPSVIWDMKENPAEGGFRGGGGVVITLVNVYPITTSPSTENVQQFNWQYDGVPGNPFGTPVETNCISTLSTYAPKTIAPFCGLSNPGPVSLPITVDDFNAVKSFSLVLRYNPTAITYVSNSSNPIFNSENGFLTIVDAPTDNEMRKITLTFNGINTISLPGNSVLSTINFNYLGGETILEWVTANNGCPYYSPNNVLKCADPPSDYYINGGVISSLAPITKIDSAVALAGYLATFTIRTWDFEDINAGTLTLNYDPDVLVYQETVPNSAIADSFTVDATISGRLAMSFSDADTSLADGTELMFVTFQFLGGSSPVTWFDDGSSCQYFHCQLPLAMTDAPQETYYLNGNITSSVFVWNGDNSVNWDSEENWPNNTLPDQFTDVTLDPASNPTYWPTFNGDLILGDDCKNLTLTGNAQLIVNGDLVITPGHTLNLGSGIIQVNGDWVNSGIFIPGTGTIEFTGTNDVSIDEGLSPDTYVGAYVRSTFSGGYTPVSGGNAGPTGNDASNDVSIGFGFTYLGTSYSQVRINTNGWLSLNLTGPDASSADNTILFNTSTPGATLSPWWDDLLADENTTISYLTSGTAPNRIFTTEWKDILAFSSGATSRLNFQVKLYETSNEIEFLYGTVTAGTHNFLESASIGIKDVTGGAGHFLEATQNSTHIVLAILKSESHWPSLNYRFSPPVIPEMDTFYKILVSKPSGNLYIARDVVVTGID